jgi:hypothetical protein
LTLLAPDIVQAVLDSRQPDEVTLPRLLESFPITWAEQRRRFSLAEPEAAAARPAEKGGKRTSGGHSRMHPSDELHRDLAVAANW